MGARAAQRMMDEVVGVIILGSEGSRVGGIKGTFRVRRETQAHKSSPRGLSPSPLLSARVLALNVVDFCHSFAYITVLLGK